MNSQELFDTIQNVTDAAPFGYIKPWKNRSVTMTLEGLHESLIRTSSGKLSKERIFNLVHSAYSMEGVREDTCELVAEILYKYFN